MRKAIGIALVVTACGGGTGSDGALDGEQLFEQSVLEQQPGCITCHSLSPDRVLVGPSLADIGVSAADRVEGLSSKEYLRQSIVEPDAYVVEGFDAGKMPTWGEFLGDAQVEALVEYLSSLGTAS